MKWKLGLYRGYLSSISFGDTMVPNIEQDYILLLGKSILHKEYDLTKFNHQHKHYSYERSGFLGAGGVWKRRKSCRKRNDRSGGR